MRNFQFPFDYGPINTDRNWAEWGLCLHWTCQGSGSLCGWLWCACHLLMSQDVLGSEQLPSVTPVLLWGCWKYPPASFMWASASPVTQARACLSPGSSNPTQLCGVECAQLVLGGFYAGLGSTILLFLSFTHSFIHSLIHSFIIWQYWAAAMCQTRGPRDTR